MSMQTGACLIKEQIGTLFVWVGALEGRFGGVRGVQPKNHTCLQFFLEPPGYPNNLLLVLI
jgi:hypothetical protein